MTKILFCQVPISILLSVPLIRACDEEGKARMGLVECLNHNLVEPFNVLYEKDGET